MFPKRIALIFQGTSGNNNNMKESPYASVRSPTKEKVLYGGGELVNTNENEMSPAQKCNMKRSTTVSSRCKYSLRNMLVTYIIPNHMVCVITPDVSI